MSLNLIFLAVAMHSFDCINLTNSKNNVPVILKKQRVDFHFGIGDTFTSFLASSASHSHSHCHRIIKITTNEWTILPEEKKNTHSSISPTTTATTTKRTRITSNININITSNQFELNRNESFDIINVFFNKEKIKEWWWIEKKEKIQAHRVSPSLSL